MELKVFCRGCGKPLHETAPMCPSCGCVQNPPQQGLPQQMQHLSVSETSHQINPKNRVAAILLAFFLGGFGGHKFYLGHWGWGIIHILFVWTFIPTIVATVELIRYAILSDEEFQKRYQISANKPFGFLW